MRLWCVQFFDWDAWNEKANTRRRYKAEAVALAELLNRTTSHADRQAFGGRRFRVRRVKET